jgi:hypothetical protein
MIDLDEINHEIDELEHADETTYRLCERLSWLYTVRDHLAPKVSATKSQGGSEFLELAIEVDYDKLMGILDEHLNSLQVVQPKAYDAVMRKIRDLL